MISGYERYIKILSLIYEIEHDLIDGGNVYGMATLLCMYQRHVIDCVMEKAIAEMYKVQNFKKNKQTNKRQTHRYEIW